MLSQPRYPIGGYEPVDLTTYCSSGAEVFDLERYDSGGTWLNPEDGASAQYGSCVFRGIPFQIGPDDGDPAAPRFVDFLSSLEPLEIDIGRSAVNVIFAHVLLTTTMWTEGTSPGSKIAEYTFVYDDGEEIPVPIRERFEIGHCPQPWGNRPFLAYPDQSDGTEPRDEGEWSRIGFRLTEVNMGTTQAYTLWVWRNPNPAKPLKSVRVTPVRKRFVIAGITTGTVDEHPFQLPPRRTVKLSGNASFRCRDIRLAVDRGVASYTYPTTDHHDPEWNGLDGWGGVSSGRSVYGYVAATPSATLKIDQDGIETSIGWRECREAQVELGEARVEVLAPDRNWVHVTVTDEQGVPVPCRVSFVSVDGIPFQPHGHQAPVQSGLRAWNLDIGGDVLLGDVSYAYIDGRCQGWLPRGKVWVEAARGFEYRPLKKLVDIAPGQRELNVVLERHSDPASRAWYSGDTHVHFLSPDGALLEADAEGLAVVHLLQAQWGHLFTNVEDFTGGTRVGAEGRVFVHVSQENRQHVLGHLNLLGLRRPVMPFSSDGPSEAELGGGLDTTTSRWADEAREQGGLVVVAHMPKPNGETAVLLATGRADGLEMIDFNHFEHLEYYRYLNGGYRIPLVAGTDKMEATIPVGLYRTYASVHGELTFESWMDAVRAGRTFASSGPIIDLIVDGAGPGEVLDRPVGATVTVHAEATSIFPIHTLQIVRGGEVVASVDAAEGVSSLRLTEEVSVSDHGWLAARCAGPGYTSGTRHFDHDRRPVMAHTSPVYFDTGAVSQAAGGTYRYLASLVEGGLSYIRQALHDPPGTVTYHHGREDHQAYLEEPFLEALAALQARTEEWERAHG